eukprot:sb/3475078/
MTTSYSIAGKRYVNLYVRNEPREYNFDFTKGAGNKVKDQHTNSNARPTVYNHPPPGPPPLQEGYNMPHYDQRHHPHHYGRDLPTHRGEIPRDIPSAHRGAVPPREHHHHHGHHGGGGYGERRSSSSYRPY